MLILSRGVEQSIVIGSREPITIKVLKIVDGRVYLGIMAPRGVPVDREEVRQAKLQNGERHDKTSAARQWLARAALDLD